MRIDRIVVAGGGVMGSQVAWQAATHGKTVTVYDVFDEGLARSRAFHEDFGKRFVAQKRRTAEEVAAARARISYTTDLGAALAGAGLVIEQVPEDLGIKQKFWQQASALAAAETLFASNTSSLLLSDMVGFIDRPEKFLALHFCVDVWDANIGEVMGQAQTAPASYAAITAFAGEIGLVPIEVRKEQPGYVLNSLLIPWLIAGIDLLRKGVCDAESIDRTWQICNKSEIGPMRMLDMVGMNAAYHIASSWAAAYQDDQAAAAAAFLKSEYIDRGRLGMAAGRGVFEYG
ncbi:MAG: 3-hydroxyacyl-CoA dehydrogenase [Alphaproteobacteria bacterium]|nr:3-hydroxyacyl-CoA dehydrogenase [Alphaproteobacteria bacterium]MCB9931638.1 3-hydroxyacyl-CoA dehydrogenase [Alphaproteobacteria bacterium]